LGYKIIFSKIDLVAQISIKQVLTPAIVAMADQAHELAGSMQREGAGFASQLQPSLFRGTVPLCIIATVAAGD
jgi:hypothetical protein